MKRRRTFGCTIVAGGRSFYPGEWVELTEEQCAHLEASGVVLEGEPEPEPVAGSPPASEVSGSADISMRVAALTSKEDALALAAELGLTLTETKLGKMRAEILALVAAKPAEV